MLSLIAFISPGWSQSDDEVIIVGLDYLTQDFYFTGKDNSTEAVFNVDEKIKFLDFSFFAEIAKGKLLVSILDPNGRDEGNFELSYLKPIVKNDEKKIIGSINRRIDNPIFGKWKIKIISIKAEGYGNAKIFNNNVED